MRIRGRDDGVGWWKVDGDAVPPACEQGSWSPQLALGATSGVRGEAAQSFGLLRRALTGVQGSTEIERRRA